MDTKEGYNVLLKRIDKRLLVLREAYFWYNACICSFLCKNARDQAIKDYNSCKSIREIVSLRLLSAGPNVQLDVPDELLEKAKVDGDGKTNTNVSNSADAYLIGGGGGCGGSVYVDFSGGGGGVDGGG